MYQVAALVLSPEIELGSSADAVIGLLSRIIFLIYKLASVLRSKSAQPPRSSESHDDATGVRESGSTNILS